MLTSTVNIEVRNLLFEVAERRKINLEIENIQTNKVTDPFVLVYICAQVSERTAGPGIGPWRPTSLNYISTEIHISIYMTELISAEPFQLN